MSKKKQRCCELLCIVNCCDTSDTRRSHSSAISLSASCPPRSRGTLQAWNSPQMPTVHSTRNRHSSSSKFSQQVSVSQQTATQRGMMCAYIGSLHLLVFQDSAQQFFCRASIPSKKLSKNTGLAAQQRLRCSSSTKYAMKR